MIRRAERATTRSGVGRSRLCRRSGPSGAFITTARTDGLNVRIELRTSAAGSLVAARVDEHEIDVGRSALPHRAIDVDGRAYVEAFLCRDVRNRGQHRGIGVDDQYPWLDVHVPAPLAPALLPPSHCTHCTGPDLAHARARNRVAGFPPERRDVRDILHGEHVCRRLAYSLESAASSRITPGSR